MKRNLPLLAVAILAGFALWSWWRAASASESLRVALSDAQRQRERAETETAKVRRDFESLQAEAARAKASVPPPADQPFENALELWLGKMNRLRAYLNANPQFTIPQMAELSAEEWLDVTKGEKFETEADYRKALGVLRGAARRKTARQIGAALAKALAANEGKLPNDTSALAPHLAGVDPSVLNLVAFNPSGTIAGLSTKTQFFLVDKPVDLWDATLFYASDGTSGTRSAAARGESAVRDAITEYTKQHGVAPGTADQIASYKDINTIPPQQLHELWRALTTRL